MEGSWLDGVACADHPPKSLTVEEIQGLTAAWAEAAKKAVEAPTKVITNKAVELYSKIGELLTNKYKPAVTSVAA